MFFELWLNWPLKELKKKSPQKISNKTRWLWLPVSTNGCFTQDYVESLVYWSVYSHVSVRVGTCQCIVLFRSPLRLIWFSVLFHKKEKPTGEWIWNMGKCCGQRDNYKHSVSIAHDSTQIYDKANHYLLHLGYPTYTTA